MSQRSLLSLLAVCSLSQCFLGCSQKSEDSPEYRAACEGRPLLKAEERNRALEDGYDINRRYDCVDKASYAAVNQQRANWEAANPPEPVALRKSERENAIVDQRSRAGKGDERKAPPSTASISAEHLAAGVYAPTFHTAKGTIQAGKAFAITLPGCKNVTLVSAYHLFGPSGGVEDQMTPEQISTQVDKISLRDIARKRQVDEFKAMSLTPADANPCCKSNQGMTGSGDVVAFQGPDELRSGAFPVATSSVKKGDKLLVITSVVGSDSKTLAHPAVAQGMDSGYLVYDFTDSAYFVRATSGAPVVNEAGEVVAINLGGGPSGSSGKMYGFGNPAAGWRKSVSRACQ